MQIYKHAYPEVLEGGEEGGCQQMHSAAAAVHCQAP